MISKGLLGEAQTLARDNLERLRPWAERGVPIVGCEPSCLLTLVDEYPELVPGELARRSPRFRGSSIRISCKPAFSSNSARRRRPVLIHGHCHQKALVGVADTRALLAQAPGAEPRVIDSGCCGMAGSFGYEHYDLSMKIGERVLFPAVRAATQASIIAPGFSCRHQIEHGTGRKAQHPIEFLADRLV